MGTGCIFEFDEEHTLTNGVGFTPDDLPNFFGSKYSLIKGFTDRLMHLFKRGIMNVRIRMPITADNSPKNFITKITNYEKICSVPNSMTVLPELIPVMIDLINRKYSGTVNLVNPGLISHNEILELYRNIVDPEFKWKNFTIAEQDEILLGKRSNNLLNTDFIEKEYPNVLGIRDSIIRVLRDYV
jgi:3,5-epimerase/4-reductase